MRKATGISPKDRENINHRTRPEKHPSGSKQAKKSNTEVRESGNDFLTSIFKPIRTIDIDPLYSEANYKYLYDSAKNYTGLLNKGFNIEYNPTDFNSLYTEFDKKVPEGQSLYIFEKDNKLHFKITQAYDNNTLYYIPCEIIDQSSGVFRDILIDFFCILKYTQKLTSQMDSYHCSGLLEELEYQEESGELDIDDDYLQLLKSYKDGDIAKTLDLVNSHPKCAPCELQKIISEYKPQSEKESEILVLLLQGLEILKYEISIFQYAEVPNSYDPAGYGEVPMSADELVMIVYADDIIVENMIESVNMSCQECECEYFCAGIVELSPDTEQAMQPEWFVVNFLEWLSKFISKLYDN
jgi:hypothetical protein